MDKNGSSVVGMWSLLFAVGLSIGMVSVGFLFSASIPEFSSLFRSFGPDVPAFTQAVFSYYVPICALLMVCLVAQAALLIALLLMRTLRVRRLFFVAVTINFVFLLALLVSMYVPIFALGAVI